jgi:hypothetical protein
MRVLRARIDGIRRGRKAGKNISFLFGKGRKRS